MASLDQLPHPLTSGMALTHPAPPGSLLGQAESRWGAEREVRVGLGLPASLVSCRLAGGCFW